MTLTQTLTRTLLSVLAILFAGLLETLKLGAYTFYCSVFVIALFTTVVVTRNPTIMIMNPLSPRLPVVVPLTPHPNPHSDPDPDLEPTPSANPIPNPISSPGANPRVNHFLTIP